MLKVSVSLSAFMSFCSRAASAMPISASRPCLSDLRFILRSRLARYSGAETALVYIKFYTVLQSNMAAKSPAPPHSGTVGVKPTALPPPVTAPCAEVSIRPQPSASSLSSAVSLSVPPNYLSVVVCFCAFISQLFISCLYFHCHFLMCSARLSTIQCSDGKLKSGHFAAVVPVTVFPHWREGFLQINRKLLRPIFVSQ